MIQIDPLQAFADNYLWLLQDTASKRCAVVDPGDAAPVFAWLKEHSDWQLTDILITHHHNDHVGGVAQLKQETGARVYGPAAENIPARDIALAHRDEIQVLGHTFKVIAVPGHTLGHIAYYCDPERDSAKAAPWLFCGDTLFAAGCGRLFEGTPEQMYQSLSELAALPDDTQVFCAHEYTLSNLKFARAVEPHNAEVAKRFEEVSVARAHDRCTLPSTLALEKRTNPFLRVGEDAVRQAVDERDGTPNAAPQTVFARLRAWKDKF